MNKREANKLKPGDLVVAHKFGIYSPVKVIRRLAEDESEGNHPLFMLEVLDGSERGPYTYLGLQLPR